ncbi:hypothetical protein [Hymenobacter sp. PAMC 26628]|uniref:hypothetical protein n=1 Tax=Hymenobacter sp. PAMC 26628 TaxID=1484118 RepID=UPI0012FFD264|nr:hypothetical protein [Hymenobacter sp. PAMC 26628]
MRTSTTGLLVLGEKWLAGAINSEKVAVMTGGLGRDQRPTTTKLKSKKSFPIVFIKETPLGTKRIILEIFTINQFLK